jgi:hypothetical protein
LRQTCCEQEKPPICGDTPYCSISSRLDGSLRRSRGGELAAPLQHVGQLHVERGSTEKRSWEDHAGGADLRGGSRVGGRAYR